MIFGLISFCLFGSALPVDQSKIFLRENIIQQGQYIYAIDNENRVCEGDIKNQKNDSENIVAAKVHPILSQKEIISIFTDTEGKVLFEDKDGFFYHEDGSIISDSVIRLQESPQLSSSQRLSSSSAGS